MPIKIKTPAISASAAISTPGIGTATNPAMPLMINQIDNKSIPALRVIRIAMVYLQRNRNRVPASDEPQMNAEAKPQMNADERR
jgi:hypothetical protein